MGRRILFLRRFLIVALLVVLSVNCFSEKMVYAEEVADSNNIETDIYISEKIKFESIWNQ